MRGASALTLPLITPAYKHITPRNERILASLLISCEPLELSHCLLRFRCREVREDELLQSRTSRWSPASSIRSSSSRLSSARISSGWLSSTIPSGWLSSSTVSPAVRQQSKQEPVVL